MLDQDCRESLKRAKNGSVDNDWSLKARLQVVLVPREVIVVPLVLGIKLRLQIFLFDSFLFLCSVLFLKLGSVFGLVLQVKSYWQLEIALDGATLMRSL